MMAVDDVVVIQVAAHEQWEATLIVNTVNQYTMRKWFDL